MAEFVMKDIVEKMGVRDDFYIASAATSTEEIWNGQGNPVYPPARQELIRRGIGKTPYTNFSNKRAVQVTRADYNKYDYILCADERNIRNTMRITGGDPENKIKLLLDYSDNPRNIADPWYTGDFSGVYKQIEKGCEGLLLKLGY
jgi:protein-tyrosine phosphatase